jgi:hypothetical protein
MDTTVVIIIAYKHEVSPTSTGCILFIKRGPGNRITKTHKFHLLWKKMPRQRETFIRFCSVSIPSRATVDSNRSFVEPSAHLPVYIVQHHDSVNTNRVQILSTQRACGQTSQLLQVTRQPCRQEVTNDIGEIKQCPCISKLNCLVFSKKVTRKSPLSAKFLGHFSPIVPPSAAGFASVASDAGGPLWRKLERSKSLVLLQAGG